MIRAKRTRKEQGQEGPRLGDTGRATMVRRQDYDDQHKRTKRTRKTMTKETKTRMARRTRSRRTRPRRTQTIRARMKRIKSSGQES